MAGHEGLPNMHINRHIRICMLYVHASCGRLEAITQEMFKGVLLPVVTWATICQALTRGSVVQARHWGQFAPAVLEL